LRPARAGQRGRLVVVREGGLVVGREGRLVVMWEGGGILCRYVDELFKVEGEIVEGEVGEREVVEGETAEGGRVTGREWVMCGRPKQHSRSVKHRAYVTQR
jgi:hypothetical protein